MLMQGLPIYPAKSVRFHFASSLEQLASASDSSPASCSSSTPEYPMENDDTLQRFSIPRTLCVGGFLRVWV